MGLVDKELNECCGLELATSCLGLDFCTAAVKSRFIMWKGAAERYTPVEMEKYAQGCKIETQIHQVKSRFFTWIRAERYTFHGVVCLGLHEVRHRLTTQKRTS